MVKAISSDRADDISQLSDEELMNKYREEGRAVLFNELVHRYERELYRYLARYLGDPTAAEDVFQNTFLQVHLKRGLFENGRPFRPWLYAIATHQAVDALRKAGRHPTVSLDRRVNAGRNDADAAAIWSISWSAKMKGHWLNFRKPNDNNGCVRASRGCRMLFARR